MKAQGYLIFHLNLAFSSIEEEARKDVINNCYHPLIDIVERCNIPVGIELTGWTLKQINKVDKIWIRKLRKLIRNKKCELIGSGYCQIIGPLVPYKVNFWSQKLGIKIYDEILDCKPEIALVNEMAFSRSMIDIYNESGYKGIVMDRDNIKLALQSDESEIRNIPTHGEGSNDSILPVLWSDSLLFQKFQHFVHGDISLDDYMDYLKIKIKNGKDLIPIYTNDAEVFDYRPGRFSEEREIHRDGEWRRVERLIKSIVSETGLKFVLPSKIVKKPFKKKYKSKLTSSAYPIPVKKQMKYNIARWAVTGRDDLWINSTCHKIERHFTRNKNNNSRDWQELCEFWSSDLRTHITDRRWNKTVNRITKFLEENDIKNNFDRKINTKKQYHSIEYINNYSNDFSLNLEREDTLIKLSSKHLELELNLRRGLAINSLAFASHEMKPCIGTLPHGYFSCISLGADYYSGGVIAEFPTQRKRITDLERVEPSFFIHENGDLEVCAQIITSIGTINKVITISSVNEELSIGYNFLNFKKSIGSIRLGILTFLNDFSNDSEMMCSNGGKDYETFRFRGEFNHSKSASTLVSSSRGLGATSGKILVKNNDKMINLSWNPELSAVMPMMQSSISEEKKLSRLLFSLREVDDTAKESRNIGSFDLLISTKVV